MNPLAWHRTNEQWVWYHLDTEDNFIAELDGVSTATLKLDIAKEIRTGGDMTWTGFSNLDWLEMRLQPVYRATLIDGTEVEWKRGVFIPATPVVNWQGEKAVVKVELFDKLLILSEDKVDQTFALPAGAIVTDEIKLIIESAGEEHHNIEDSTETLTTPLVWEIGTSKLRIINDLLEMINYFSIWCDELGYYRGTPYVTPQKRGSAWDFYDGVECIYKPEFEHENDYFGVPNKVILVSQGDGDTEGMVSVATNEDPEDKLSFQQRGRWVTTVETGVEATSQAILNELAVRRLEDLSLVISSVSLPHALVPIDLNNLVNFRRIPANLSFRAVVQEMTIPCTVGGLVTSQLRQVK